jgi:hypothetical protein
MKSRLLTSVLVLALASVSARAAAPGLISHQGRVTVSGASFTGTGQFKFALVDAAGTTTYWSNDGSSTTGIEPTAAVSLTVARGIFAVNLGEAITGMTQPIPASVFSNNGTVYLRTWFNDGTTGSQLITPDVRLTSVGYALRAETAADYAASAASGIVAGDLTTWNAKVGPTRAIGTTAPLTGGGALSADLTLSLPVATSSANGYLASADWTTFNAKTPTNRTISTTAPLTGGGSLYGNLTLALPVATSSANGYLSSTDWSTFNGKANSGANVNITGLTGLTTPLSATQGGSGQSSYTIGDILYASTTTALSKLGDVATGNALISGGANTAPAWGKVALTTHVSGTLPVANGGTGAGTASAGLNNLLPTQTGNAGEVLTTDGSSASWAASGGLTWIVNNLGTSIPAAAGNGYLARNAALVTITLPASPAIGNVIRVAGAGAGGWKIAQNSGQAIVGLSAATVLSGVSWTERTNSGSRSWYGLASTADGAKLVGAVYGGQLYTSTTSGINWTARDSTRNWRAVASSGFGMKLVAVVENGQIYTSTDQGFNWAARDSVRNWRCVASSADGAKLVAGVSSGQLYTSTDSGTNWTARGSTLDWRCVASSSDGTKLVAGAYGSYIYTSTDSGVTWTAQTSSGPRNWAAVASSEDGTKLLSNLVDGNLYRSTDSGITWTATSAGSRTYAGLACSADGTRLVASVSGGNLHVSTDSGATWTARMTDTTRAWGVVVSSADGLKLAAPIVGGTIYTSATANTSATTTGTDGYLTGPQYSAIELLCISTTQFIPLSSSGTINYY